MPLISGRKKRPPVLDDRPIGLDFGSAPESPIHRAILTVACAAIAGYVVIGGTLHCLRNVPFRDEFASQVFASLTPGELWQATSHVDRSMTAYYLLVSPLSHVSDPILAMRFLSLAAVTAAIGLTVFLAQRAAGAWAGLLTALMLAGNTQIANTAATARSMSLYVLAVSAANLALWALRPGSQPSRRASAGYAIAWVVAVLMNVLSIAGMLAHVVFVLVAARDRQVIRRALPAWALASVAAGIILVGSRGQSAQLAWIDRPTPYDLYAVVRVMTGGTTWHVLAVTAATVAVVAAWRLASTGRRLALLGASVAIVPPAVVFIASRLAVPAMLTRYVEESALGFAVLVGAAAGPCVTALANLARRERARGARWADVPRWGLSAALVAGALTPIPHNSPAVTGPPLRAWLSEHARPGDRVAFWQAYSQTGTVAGIAQELHDQSLWDEAVRQVAHGPERFFTVEVESASPWRTHPVPFPTDGNRLLVITVGRETPPSISDCDAPQARLIQGDSVGYTRTCRAGAP